MTAHLDILEESEHLAKPFWTSVFLHVTIAAALLSATLVGPGARSRLLMGDPKGGGGVSGVPVQVANTIPLPQRNAPMNPVANPTESAVPAAPAKTRTPPKTEVPDPNAISLKGRDAKKRSNQAAEMNKFLAQQKFLKNQLYSSSGQALNSPMLGMKGNSGVGVGNNSPFGTQFGYYATILRDRVAEKWRTSDIDARLPNAPVVVVTFTIMRNGTVPSGSVKVSQTSGNRSLDFSAQRAVLDAAPFPELPAGFPRSQADVELRFELRR